jgi:hypothetical protein
MPFSSSPEETTMSSIYDTDFYAWTQEQAALLRAGKLAEIETEHVAEELESMGASERQALSSRLTELLMHLLKWKYQPERRSSSWVRSINKQRIGIDALLDESPSLKYQLPSRFEKAYPKARRYAAIETGLPLATFPEACPFGVEDTLSPEFWPA